MKILSDGLIHQSEATLYAALGADWSGARGVLAQVRALLGLKKTAARL